MLINLPKIDKKKVIKLIIVSLSSGFVWWLMIQSKSFIKLGITEPISIIYVMIFTPLFWCVCDYAWDNFIEGYFYVK